ncbi:MAG: hypothetical protein KAT83_02985 [Candidatus Aenigmarchaeota archaeon]|nr:hypothetical protein [Candidatus Aenigmarchaeota archaeon]
MVFDVRDLKEGFGFLSSFYSDVAPEMPYIEYGVKLDSFAEYLLSQEPNISEERMELSSMKQKPFLGVTENFLRSKGYSSKQLKSKIYNEPILYAQPKRSISSLGRKGTGDTLWFDLMNLDEIKIFFPDIKDFPVPWDKVSPKTIEIIANYGRILNLISKEIPEEVLHPKLESIPTRLSYQELMAQV